MVVKVTILTALVGAALALPNAASAGVVVSIQQAGNDVSLTASGAFNTALATSQAQSVAFGQTLQPSFGFFGFGSQGSVTFYRVTAGTSTFGTSEDIRPILANTGIGIALNVPASLFFLSSSYVSQSPITSSGTISNSTISSLGLTSGVYDYMIGGNVLTVNVGAVPEPASWATMILGMGAVGGALRRRSKIATRVTYAV